MNAIESLPLVALADLMQIDILFWLVALFVVVFLLLSLIWQQRQYKKLGVELTMLNGVKRRTIEYDLVLKAMKLAMCGSAPSLMIATIVMHWIFLPYHRVLM